MRTREEGGSKFGAMSLCSKNSLRELKTCLLSSVIFPTVFSKISRTCPEAFSQSRPKAFLEYKFQKWTKTPEHPIRGFIGDKQNSHGIYNLHKS